MDVGYILPNQTMWASEQNQSPMGLWYDQTIAGPAQAQAQSSCFSLINSKVGYLLYQYPHYYSLVYFLDNIREFHSHEELSRLEKTIMWPTGLNCEGVIKKDKTIFIIYKYRYCVIFIWTLCHKTLKSRLVIILKVTSILFLCFTMICIFLD